jgi:hypothetical protein
MSWPARARGVIREIDAGLPKDIAFADRVKALRVGYPFAERSGWAYKSWLAEQKRYLMQFAPANPAKESKRFPLSPMERMMLKAGA